MMLGWTYVTPGILQDETHGPVSDNELEELAYGGKITPQTRVIHPKHTRNQWVELSRIPHFAKAFEQGEAHRQAARRQQKEERQDARRVRKMQKAAARDALRLARARSKADSDAADAVVNRAYEPPVLAEAVDSPPPTEGPQQTVTPVVHQQPSGSVSHGFGVGFGMAMGILFVIVGLPILACGGCLFLGSMSEPSEAVVMSSPETSRVNANQSASSKPKRLENTNQSPPRHTPKPKRLEITDVAMRVIESNDIWAKYAWVLEVRNNTERAISFDAELQFLDRDGFVVDSDREYRLVVAPNAQKTFRGFDLIRMPGANRVVSVNAIAELN